MLNNLIYPKTVALIGASPQADSVGLAITKNLINSQKQNPELTVSLVNPKYDEILNQKSYHSIDEISDKVDLVVLAIPAKYCLSEITKCADKGVKAIILVSSGFSEVGDHSLESQIQEICKVNNISLLGPNCLGMYNPTIGLNASFGSVMPPSGNIALLSQSGAICTAIIDKSRTGGMGFSTFLSTGNKLVVGESELIDFLEQDKNTDIIAIYSEGIQNAAQFIQSCRSSSKPIVILKSGRTTKGSAATSSHTGALASDNRLYSAMLQQSGAIVCDDLQEFVLTLQAFSLVSRGGLNGKNDGKSGEAKIIQNPKTQIITNAGGPGVLATDASEKYELNLSQISDDTKSKLQAFLPASASYHNPLDLIGDATLERYSQALQTIIGADEVDQILVILTPQSMTQPSVVASEIVKLQKTTTKSIYTCFIGGASLDEAKKTLSDNNIPNFEYPELAVKVIKNIQQIQGWTMVAEKTDFNSTKKIVEVCTENQITKPTLETKHDKTATLIPYTELQKILGSNQITQPKNLFFENSETNSKNISEQIQQISTSFANSSKVVIKLYGPNLIHKTEYGAIKIVEIKDIETELKNMWNICKEVSKEQKIEGITVHEYVKAKNQLEIIVGIKNDPSLGEYLSVGLGGTLVNLFEDVSFGFLPLKDVEIESMINRLKCSKILDGYRNQPALNKAKLIQIIQKLINIVNSENISEIEVNPVLVSENEAVAVDLKIFE